MKTSLLIAVCSAFTLTLLSAAQAQMPPAAGAAPGANPTAAPDPMRLPGDLPPPPMGAVPRPAGGGGPPPDATPSPSLALGLEAAQAALDACTADGLRVGVAVVDSAGQLHVGLIAEGARPGRIYTAVRKDLVALAFKTPTSEVQAKLAAGDPAAAALVKPNMMTVAGAVPLMVGDQLLGAIGVSGATSQQDEKCAAAGAAKIKAKLK